MNRTLAVIYRTGGTTRCQWHRVGFDATFTSTEAHDEVERLGKMGYHALAVDAKRLAAVGLPEGWEYKRGGHEVLS